MFNGDAPAIFILRCVLRHQAVEVGNFHSHLAPWCEDGFVTSWQSVALFVAGANTQRAALAEQQRTHFLFLLRSGQNRQQRARAILFHLHRRGENIECTFGESKIGEVTDELRIEIVEIGFQDRDLLLD